MGKLNLEVIFYPGKTNTLSENEKLVKELKEVAALCFDELPYYQVLTGEKVELDRAVISTARNDKGELLGFCSALILPIEGFGNVFHTGLTCVHPKARGLKLTHKLTSKLLTKYLVKESLFSETWITNCACVLSSIGNVALYFEDVYPSPYGPIAPSMSHIKIANGISKHYRDQIAINETANFNLDNFVFESSVEGTLFLKDEEDKRFHHRNNQLNDYYKNLLDFERGDEVLQVGKVSLMTLPKYFAKQTVRKFRNKKSVAQDSYVYP